MHTNTYATFVRKKETFGANTEISIVNKDNLELLKSLPEESVNLIYCDIPYNSGKVFDDYDDAMFSTKEEAVKWYRPRLIEMKRVLAANGSIYIHCNWRLNSRIQILMDEVFGESCYMSSIARQFAGFRNFPNKYDSQYDVIHYYVKNPEEYVFNSKKDTSERFSPLFENGNAKNSNDVRLVNGKEITLPENKCWIVSEKVLENLAKKNEVVIVDGLPYRKTHDIPIGNLWVEPCMYDEYSRTKQAEAYDTPKPESVLERIICTSSNPGDVVADFFMGGGTTAVVSAKMERSFIGCDVNLKACEETVKKLKKLHLWQKSVE